MSRIQDLVGSWITEAAEHIKQELAAPLVIQEKKDRKDLVTNLDKETEQFFRNKIHAAFPDDQIIGEEGMGQQATDKEGAVWLIDPIDGTKNFVMQKNNFAMMIARYVDGVGEFGAIYDVMQQTYLEATKGEGVRLNHQPYHPPFEDRLVEEGLVAISENYALENKNNIQCFIQEAMGYRVLGSAGLSIIAALKGELILYASPRLEPWDAAAGQIIAQEAGLSFTQFDGTALDLSQKNTGVIGFPSAHQAFVEHYQNNLS